MNESVMQDVIGRALQLVWLSNLSARDRDDVLDALEVVGSALLDVRQASTATMRRGWVSGMARLYLAQHPAGAQTIEALTAFGVDVLDLADAVHGKE